MGGDRTTATGRRAVAKAARFGLLHSAAELEEAKRMPGGTEYTKRGTGNNDLAASDGSTDHWRASAAAKARM